MLTSTYKAYYYNFLPSKEEEVLINANPNPHQHQPARFLVEVRDFEAPPTINPNDPWKIKKKITWLDLRNGRLTLTHDEAFDHVFRYWSLSLTSLVVFSSHKIAMAIWDHSNWLSDPKKYVSHNIYFERGPNDTYHLGWADVFHDLLIRPGDEIGLYWDFEQKVFHMKRLSSHS